MKFSDLDIGIAKDELDKLSKEELSYKQFVFLSKSNNMIVVHLNKFFDILKFPDILSNRGYTACTDKNILLKGHYGSIYGMSIYVFTNCPEDQFFIEEEWEKLKILA